VAGVGLVLLLSGAAALCHQAVWFRALTPVLGAGPLTAAAVSAGALLGLAIGAAWGGRLAARARSPLWLVAGAEVLGALLALGVPWAASALAAAVEAGGAGATPLPLPWAVLAAVVACAAAALPLGVTVPAALGALRPAAERAASSFRWLYGVNTLGAVVGVLLAGGFALEALGQRGTVRLAAALQGGVALLAWALGARLRRDGPARDTGGALAAPARIGAPLLAAAALAGAAGLAIQVAWVRRLTPAVGTTTQSFATVLAAHLLAIALGSLLLGPRPGARDRSVWVLALAAVPAALLPPAIGAVARWTSEQALVTEAGPFALLGLRALAAGLLLVPSTLLASAALPWLLARAAPTPADAPRVAGRVVAWNTLGSTLGAVLAGGLWIPAVGSAAVLRGAAGLLVLGAACVAERVAARVLLVVLACVLLAQPWVAPCEDAAGRDAVGASFLPAQFAIADAPALSYAEGASTTVVVREREGHRELWVEGKIEASTQPTDRLHLALLGALPMALHPAPERVAIVGLGTGRSAQAVAAFGPERLLVLEIEPEVVRSVGLFAEDGGGLPAGAEVRIGDARHALARSAEVFDVITSDPVHPGVAGSASLYSREMYDLVLRRLAQQGLFCQWLPLYQLTGDDVRLTLRTFVRAFPETWIFLAGEDLVLVGSRAPVRVEEAALRARLEGPAGAPLQPLGLATPGRLLGLVLKDPVGVTRFAGAGPINEDDRLLLEFQAGRSWFVNEPYANLLRLWPGRARAPALLAAAPSPAFEAEAQRAERLLEAVRAWLAGDMGRATEAFSALSEADPADGFAREMRNACIVRGLAERASVEAPEGVIADVTSAAASDDLTPSQRLDIAALLRELGAVEQGREIAAQVGARVPSPRARRLAGP
jgi:spermidine synthase